MSTFHLSETLPIHFEQYNESVRVFIADVAVGYFTSKGRFIRLSISKDNVKHLLSKGNRVILDEYDSRIAIGDQSCK